jgi:hypothetical protein
MDENENKSAVTPISASIRPEQRAMLIEHAKQSGFISISEALRAVLDEWKRDREREFSQQTAQHA